MEQGNPHALPSGRSIVRKIQCAGGKDARKRRHPRKGRKWIKNRYWHPKGNREWSFRTDGAILYQMMDMPIVRIRSLDLKRNPFLDSDYFEYRRKQHKKDRETAYFSSTAARSGYYAL